MFKVYLGEMEAEAFTGTNVMAWADMTEVYSGSLSVSGGIMEITFTTPYSYQGDNLVIGVNQTVTGTQGGYETWYGISDSGNRALYSVSGSFYVDSSLPKTTLTYTAGIAPTCPKPRNLTATLTDGDGTIATLNWTEKGSASTWVVQCGTDADFGTGTYSEYTVTTTPTEELTGLTPDTTYYARVKSDCGGGDQSAWSTVCEFTPSNALSILLNNGTETSSYVPLVSPPGYGSQFIIPAETLSAVAYGQIKGLAFHSTAATASWGANSYEVYLMETTDAYFSGNTSYPVAPMTKVYTGTFSVVNNLMTIDFDTSYYYEGDHLLVCIKENYGGASSYCYWYGVNTTNNQALSGDFGNTLYKFLPKTTMTYLPGETPAHPRPKYFTNTGVTSTSASFTWTNGGNESAWQIAYTDNQNTLPDDIPASNIVDVTSNPYTLGGLVGGTTYYAYIRAIVGNEHSDWSKVCSFTPECHTPTDFGPQSVTINSAKLNWTIGGNESEWQIVYAAEDANFDPDLADPIAVTTKPYTLTGLTTDVHYYARIRAKCDIGDYSDWSEACEIYPTCKEAYNLKATILGPTSVKLNWTAGGNQTSWQIAYTDNAQTLPDNATIVDVTAYPPYTLTGLSTNVTYYAYVRSVCGTDHYSDWSPVCTFTPTYILTVNDGTTYNLSIPVYGNLTNNTTQSQFIIPAEALTSIAYASITKLAFYTWSPASINWGTATFAVSMKEVEATSFSSPTYDWSDTTRVYTGTLSVSNNVMEIVLDKAFQYEEGNLCIGFNQIASGTSNYSFWYGVSTSSYTALGGYGTSNSLEQFLPKVSLTYTPGTPPSCPKPKNLAATSVTAHSATLAWTNGGEETAWQMVVSTNPDFNPDIANPIAITSNPYVLTGLTEETSYYAYVRANCDGNEVSAWSNLCEFTPTALSTLTVNEGTASNSFIPIYGYAVSIKWQSQFVIPATALSDMNGKDVLKMTYYCNQNEKDWGNAEFAVEVKEVNETALTSTDFDWTQMTTLYSGSLAVNGGLMTIIFNDAYHYQGGNLLIGFRQTKTGTDAGCSWKGITTSSNASLGGYVTLADYNELYQFLPQVAFSYYADACDAPSQFTSTAVGITTATLDWTANNSETAWEIAYSSNAQFDPDQVNPVQVSVKPYTIEGLEPETTYYAYIRSNCSAGRYSDWSSVCSFTPTFPAPQNLTAQSVDAYSATLAWTAGGDESTWQISYNNVLVDVDENPYTLTGLTSGTSYDVYVRATSGNYHSAWSNLCSFETQAVCTEPQNLTVSTTTRSALLTWTAGDAETSWQVQYKGHEDAEWSAAVTVDAPEYAINGLTPSTQYDVRVCAACQVDFLSDWVTESFTTCDVMTITAQNTLVEDFDGIALYELPNCWSVIKGSELYYPFVASDNSLYFHVNTYNDPDAGAQYALLPEMSNINQVQMHFSASGDPFSVGVMEGQTFHEVKAFGSTGEEEFVDLVVYFDQYTGNGTHIAIQLEASSYAELSVDDIVVSPLPSCFMPSDPIVSASDETTATLTWTPYVTGTDWQVQYSTNGTSWTSVDVESSEFVNDTYVLAGLAASTIYQVRVRAHCGGSDYSEWTHVATFATACALYTDDALLEDFDHVEYGDWSTPYHMLPLCWQYINESTHWENMRYPGVYESGLGDNFSQSFPGYLRMQINSQEEYDPHDQYAILPEISNVHEKQLKFSASGGEWGYGGTIIVGVMTDPADASSFTAIRSLGADGIGYRDYTVYFDDYPSGQSGYIAFKLPVGGFVQVYIEDVAVTPAPSCRMPFDFVLKDTPTETTATFDWDENGMTQWELQYRTLFADWTSVSITTAPPFTLTGLVGGTFYEVRLRAVCDNGGSVSYSDWCNNMVTFNTDCPSDYQAIPYYQDFDLEHLIENASGDGYITCWAGRINTYNSHDYPVIGSGMGGHSGGGDLYFYMNGPSNSGAYQMAVLPKMQNVNTLQMSFYAKGTTNSEIMGLYYYCDFEVGVVTDPNDGSTFVPVAEISPDRRNYTKYIVSFGGYTGEGEYIAIKKGSSTTLNRSLLYIDDIFVSEIVNYTNTFTCTDNEGGDWNEESYWSKGVVPTMEDNVLIVGKAIVPNGCVAEANIVDYGTNGSILIQDGGQLKHNNMGLEASVEKEIAGYGTASHGNYYLIASPMVGSLDAKTNQYFGIGDVMGLLDNEYDLYRFSTAYEEEWRNYKKDLFTIDMASGYLYAINEGVILTFNGTLMPSVNDVEVGLLYQGGTDFAGYNLIGNPFACNAYLGGDRDFYRINSEGTNLIAASGAIAPCEGVFVQATASGQTVSFSRTPSRGKGMLDFSLNKGRGLDADRAVIRFGEGHNLSKISLLADPDQLYIPKNGKDYAVVHSEGKGEMPLNFKAADNGTYTIQVNTADAKMAYLHLVDNLTGRDIDLMETPSYTFDARRSDYASRFKVVFATADSVDDDFAFISNGEIIVNGEGLLQIFDILGHQLFSKELSTPHSSLHTPHFHAGVYVLRLINGENVRTQRIVVK